MDEKYIIYVIPTTGKKMYVPEAEVESFQQDYPDAVLFEESDEHKNQMEADHEKAVQESKYTDALNDLNKEPEEEDEETLNKNHRDKVIKSLDDLTGDSMMSTDYIKQTEGFDKDPNKKWLQNDQGEIIEWTDFNNIPVDRDGRPMPGEEKQIPTGYTEYIPSKRSHDRSKIPTDILKNDRLSLLNTSEENLSPVLNDIYGDYGFSFSGAKLNSKGEVLEDGSDMLYVTAANGKTKEISIDNHDIGSTMMKFGYMGDPDYFTTDKEASSDLARFLEENAAEYSPKSIKSIQEAKKDGRLVQFYDQEILNKEADVIERRAAAIDNIGKELEGEINTLNEDFESLQSDIDKGVIKDQGTLDERMKGLREREAQIKIDQKAIKGVYDREVIGQYAAIKNLAAEKMQISANTGSQGKVLFNTVFKSIDDLGEWAEDMAFSGVNLATGEDDIEQIEKVSKSIGKDNKINKREDETPIQYKERLITNMKKYTDDKGKGLLERELGFNEFGKSNEFEQKFLETTWGQVSTSAVQMLTYALLTRGAGGGGAAASTARTMVGRGLANAAKSPLTYMFGASASANSMDEMEKPEFDKVPMWKKQAFSNLRGSVQGVLENIGVSGALNGSKVVNKILTRAIGKAGTNATYKTVEKLFENEIKNSLAKGLIRVTGGALIEGETEVVQEIADVGLKNLFNTVEKSGVLKEENSPELFGDQQTDLSVENLAHVGKVGFLSGLMFGGFGASVQAYQENALDKINKKQFALADYLVSSPEARKIYAANLRNEIQQGKITKKEAQERLRAVRQMGGAMQQMPKDLTREGKQKAFSLVLEKSKLESLVKDKDKSLYKPQLDRISEINSELETVAFEQTKAKQLERNLNLTASSSGDRNIDYASFKNPEEFKKALEDRKVNSDEVVAYSRDGKKLGVADVADGLYLDLGNGTILINEAVAENTGAISVGTHELLHDITKDRLKKGNISSEQLVKDFKSILSDKEMSVVQDRVNKSYGGNPTTEEYFNAFHDAIVKGDIQYSDNVFTKMGEWITENILKPMGIKKAGFENGKQVYRFIKDYSVQTKRVVEGRQEGFEGDIARQVGQKSDTTVSEDTTAKPSVTQEIVDENTRLSEQLSEAIEQEDSQGINDIKNDLFLNNEGTINQFINQKFKPGLGIDREDFASAVNEEVLLRLNKTYDPSKGEYGAYIKEALFGGGKFGGGRLGNILRSLGQDGDLFTKDVEDIEVQRETAIEQEEVAEDVKRKPKIKLKDRLSGDLKPVLEAINAQISNLDIDNLNFKSLKDIALQQVQELFGVVPKKGNLTKSDVRAAQQYINKNADALIALLPEGATPSGTSTGVQKVLLDNFYNKRERATMAKTGSAAGLSIFEKKSNINPKDFKSVFGITPAGQPNLADRNTSARVKSLIAQTERMLVNQQVREVLGKQGREIPSAITEGKSEQMFSISRDIFSTEEQANYAKLSQARDINTVVKNAGIGSVSINDSNRKDFQLMVETAIKEYGLSLNVFESAMPASGGAVRTRVGKTKKGKLLPIAVKLENYLKENNIKYKQGDVYYKLKNNKGWVKAVAKGKQFVPPTDVVERGDLLAARGRLYFGKDDPAYQRAMDAAKGFGGKDIAKPQRVNIKEGVKITKEWLNGKTRKTGPTRAEQMDINMDVLEDVSMQLQGAIRSGMDPRIAALLIAQGYQATNGLVKISAGFGYVSENFEYSETGKQSKGKVAYREEHNPPASVIGATLIEAIVKGQVDQVFPFIRENYYQTQLSFKDDFKLDKARLDATLPEGTSILYNTAIRLTKAGINLNTIINIRTGNTMAQDIGIALPSDAKDNITAVARQNELIEEAILENKNVELLQELLDKELPVLKSEQEASIPNEEMINSSKVMASISLSNGQTIEQAKVLDKALENARSLDKTIKKIRVFDFDDTIARSNSLVFYTKKDGSQGELTAEQFAERGAQLVKDGAVMDFSDFNIVREGERGPLFEVAKKIKAARGNEDLFILTARAPESQQAIYDFLKSEGLEFKKENIVGLGNSTGEAKAAWLVNKAAEGYNDFYFADDALQNVDAVKAAMSQLDVKSKVQQARPQFSITLSDEFNNIIEQTSGISSEKTYSAAKAKTVGASKGRFKFFIPPSAEDFVGLIYGTLAKGKLGEQQLAWYKENLLDPFARAMQSLSQARVQLMSDYAQLKKDIKDVPKTLKKKNEDGFSYEQALRAYIWDKQGMEVPGLSASDMKDFRKIVLSDPSLQAFAEQLIRINKLGEYPPPDSSWLAGDIASDLTNGLDKISRKKYLQEWQQNADAIFSEQNLNKLEALYGSKYRESLENILERMKTGRNRLEGGSRLSNKVLDYLNGSIGAIMFFNMRSAVLQTISAINFLNWSDNSPIAAGKAFANQKQYWADFLELMNGDFLKDRRDGVRINVTESEIADMAKTSKNKAKAVMAYIIEKGYLPTKFADSFAIASGGATFYRNRINMYIKEGMTEAEAKAKALLDFQEIAEESQQSSRPDRISQQQASPMGRLLLAFANTPMQYTRLTKRAFQDLMAGRGDRKSNVSKIVYYMAVQNLIFNAMQSGLFALGFGDDEEDDEKKNKLYLRNANGMADSILRGLGVGGQAVSVAKNFLLDLYERSGRKRPDYVDSVYKLLQFSPPISSKISKVRQAAFPFDSKKRRQEMIDLGFSLENPAYESTAKVISATTNLPLDRVLLKYKNIETALTEDLQTWQKVAMLLGWPQWQIQGNKKDQEKPKSNRSKSRVQKRTGSRVQSRKSANRIQR